MKYNNKQNGNTNYMFSILDYIDFMLTILMLEFSYPAISAVRVF